MRLCALARVGIRACGHLGVCACVRQCVSASAHRSHSMRAASCVSVRACTLAATVDGQGFNSTSQHGCVAPLLSKGVTVGTRRRSRREGAKQERVSRNGSGCAAEGTTRTRGGFCPNNPQPAGMGLRGCWGKRL
eukprot:6197432-Pleurochrysis_carterae.AAC.1